MITKKLEKVHYKIYGKDELGLIPEGVIECEVGYEVSGRGKNPIYVIFEPFVDFSNAKTFVEDLKEYHQEKEKLNPKRTEKEIREIASLLENRLDDFD
jgi:hypothetical protein